MDYVRHIGSSGSAPMAGVARNKTNVNVSMCNYDTENVEGLKFTNIRFKQEWHNLSDEDRDQYNCFARDLRNIDRRWSAAKERKTMHRNLDIK